MNGRFLPVDNIILTDEQLAIAVELSQRCSNVTQQWQAYLNGLALLGIEQWLQKRSPELSVRRSWQEAEQLSVITQLQVGEFCLCLLASDSLEDAEIAVTKTALEQAPHFYVLVEVFEELGQVSVAGYMVQAQLVERLQSTDLLATDPVWLPLSWFELEPDRLLLYLQCLEPSAISIASLNNSPQSSLIAALEQQTINVSSWLKDQIDQMAEQLAWVLLPPPSLSYSLRSLRSPIEQFNQVVTLMNQQNLHIPRQARGAYRDLNWEGLALRLYAITWELAAVEPEWTLLMVLGTQPEGILPLGIQLQVRDEAQILAEPVLRDRSHEYLYAQVAGTLHERFWVTIHLDNGASMTLPPFTFVD